MPATTRFLPFETFLAMIRNAVGSRQFTKAYVIQKGRRVDATQNGRRSCAFFASNILRHFGYIKETHLTVSGLEHDLVACGWKRVRTPKSGDVLVWEPLGKDPHSHIGFYLGRDKAVSTSSSRGTIQAHHWTYGKRHGQSVRAVACILHPPRRFHHL